LTLVELASPISRNILKYENKVPQHIRMYDEREKVRILVKQVLNSPGKVAYDKLSVERFDGIELFHIFRKAFDHAPYLTLRALPPSHHIRFTAR
jgi:hypothetical protein